MDNMDDIPAKWRTPSGIAYLYLGHTVRQHTRVSPLLDELYPESKGEHVGLEGKVYIPIEPLGYDYSSTWLVERCNAICGLGYYPQKDAYELSQRMLIAVKAWLETKGIDLKDNPYIPTYFSHKAKDGWKLLSQFGDQVPERFYRIFFPEPSPKSPRQQIDGSQRTQSQTQINMISLRYCNRCCMDCNANAGRNLKNPTFSEIAAAANRGMFDCNVFFTNGEPILFRDNSGEQERLLPDVIKLLFQHGVTGITVITSGINFGNEFEAKVAEQLVELKEQGYPFQIVLSVSDLPFFGRNVDRREVQSDTICFLLKHGIYANIRLYLPLEVYHENVAIPAIRKYVAPMELDNRLLFYDEPIMIDNVGTLGSRNSVGRGRLVYGGEAWDRTGSCLALKGLKDSGKGYSLMSDGEIGFGSRFGSYNCYEELSPFISFANVADSDDEIASKRAKFLRAVEDSHARRMREDPGHGSRCIDCIRVARNPNLPGRLHYEKRLLRTLPPQIRTCV